MDYIYAKYMIYTYKYLMAYKIYGLYMWMIFSRKVGRYSNLWNRIKPDLVAGSTLQAVRQTITV